MSSILPLPGSECILTHLGGDPHVAQRLAQMGVLPGVRLRVVRLAPLGGTLEVALEEGELLALRTEELAALGCDYRVLALSQADKRPAKAYRVHHLAGGSRFKERMTGLGLHPGAILHPKDPWTVQVEGREDPLTLGWGEANKILVEPLDDP